MSQALPHLVPMLHAKALPQTYAELLVLHPLSPIHTAEECAQATVVLDLLAGHDLNADQTSYLDALTTLVEHYDQEHDPLPDPTLNVVEILRLLLAEHEMSVADFARLLGVHPTLGAKLLTEEATFTASHLATLSTYFQVSPTLWGGCALAQRRPACDAQT